MLGRRPQRDIRALANPKGDAVDDGRAHAEDEARARWTEVGIGQDLPGDQRVGVVLRSGPMAGRFSKSASVALLMLILPPGCWAEAPPAADVAGSPFFGTTTCSPSTSGRARLIACGWAPGMKPPAARTASITRAP